MGARIAYKGRLHSLHALCIDNANITVALILVLQNGCAFLKRYDEQSFLRIGIWIGREPILDRVL